MKSDRPLIALVLGFALLAVTVVAAIVLVQQQQRTYAWVTHALRVENQLGVVLSHLQDAETGQRGYLLTGRADYLEPYRSATSRIDGDLAKLDSFVADNPRQVVAAQRLRGLATARLATLREGMDVYREDSRQSAIALVRQGRGKALMDQIRDLERQMRGEEERLLDARNATARTQAQAVTVALAFTTVAIFVLGAFAFRDGRRRLAQAVQAKAEVEGLNAQLTEAAESRAVAESKVRQMQKMEAIGQLTGGIAHDFNNMLAIVIGSLDVAKRRLASDPARTETCIDNAMDGAQRAAQLTGRLLAFSRQQPLAPRVLDANKLVGGMSEMLRRTVGEHLRVETVLAGGLWNTFADPGQLESAILNLCVNARDAMPDGGRLTLETNNAYLDDAYGADHADVAAGQYVMVSVRETGAGMPAEVAERAFDPFYTTTGTGRGTGLGLSQVHGFVKQSGGHVKIYS
ncbi:MAG: CHASE3 domain-containing protein, partial [Caulobacterales bacterium]